MDTQTDLPQSSDADESYWAALLSEGEYAQGTATLPPYENNDHYSLPISHKNQAAPLSPNLNQNDNWDQIQKIQQDDQILSLEVKTYNRGGLLVELMGLSGFIPASQLIHFPPDQDHAHRRHILISHVGKTLNLRIIELEPEKHRLILSERAAQVESGTRAQILDDLNTGNQISGTVTNLCDFGAFIDLGGVEGLIHISELSWGRVNHPADILNTGQTITAYVLEVDPQNARIALSIKRLKEDPWKIVRQKYQIDEIVTVTVTNVVDFGAFACLEEGLEGLIHFSELAEGHFLHPRNVVTEGDVIKARILTIDSTSRRLGLSLRLT